MERGEGPRELRAFDWVDYLLYLAATAWFAVPALSLLITGNSVDFLPAAARYGLAPSLQEQEGQFWYQVVASFFVLFVTFVYLRNYIVMHAIDDRREGEHLLFHFVDYNVGGWSRAERVVRATIVLWVLTSAIGAVPWVTGAIWAILRGLTSWTVGFATFQTLTMMQAFFAYYGFVILVLFLLFMSWDLVNIASISRQIKKGRFNGLALGPDSGFNDVVCSRNCEFAVPASLARAIPAYGLVAYVRPRQKALGDLSRRRATTRLDQENKAREWVSSGKMFRLYFSFSGKFEERLTGIVIGTILVITPMVSASSLNILLTIMFAAIGFYGRVMAAQFGETLYDAWRYLVDFGWYGAPDWADDTASPAPNPESDASAPVPAEGSQ